MRDREGTASVPVRYVGAVPDPFREGREVIVTVRKQGDTFVGERDSLVTKCPSKFTDKPQPADLSAWPILGRACLILALAVCVYGIGASLYGARTGGARLGRLGRGAPSTRSRAADAVAFARPRDRVPALGLLASPSSPSHSSTTTPTFYRAAAAWSSQEGSLLLWVCLLSLWSSLVLFLTRRRLRDVTPYATAVLLGFGAFFAALLVFSASPFTSLARAAARGRGPQPAAAPPEHDDPPARCSTRATRCSRSRSRSRSGR